MVYPNYIKKILVYAIKLLAYIKVLKSIILLSLILRVLIKGYIPN